MSRFDGRMGPGYSKVLQAEKRLEAEVRNRRYHAGSKARCKCGPHNADNPIPTPRPKKGPH